jgi:hypothetical protein
LALPFAAGATVSASRVTNFGSDGSAGIGMKFHLIFGALFRTVVTA